MTAARAREIDKSAEDRVFIKSNIMTPEMEIDQGMSTVTVGLYIDNNIDRQASCLPRFIRHKTDLAEDAHLLNEHFSAGSHLLQK